MILFICLVCLVCKSKNVRNIVCWKFKAVVIYLCKTNFHLTLWLFAGIIYNAKNEILAICCNTNQRMITSSKYCFFWQEENICPTDCWKFLFIVEHQLHIWTNIKLLNEADGDFNLIMVSWRIIFFFIWADFETCTRICGV